MVAHSEKLGLRPDEFAFYFSTRVGVEAKELGNFLQRAATLARRQGAELQIVATHPGSLAVILKTFRKSAVARAASKEFSKTPVAVTTGTAALVVSVSTAIISAMNPQPGYVTPLAKAGAELVEESNVSRIEIITVNKNTIVMDQDRAKKVRQLERSRTSLQSLPAPDIRELIGYARKGDLSGSVLDVDGELHFRPDGHRFLVPINMSLSEAREDIYPRAHFRISGEILTRDGQPDAIIIQEATRV